MMQYAEPKCHTLNTNIFTPSLNIFPARRPVPHVDEGDGGVEARHHDVRHAEVQQEVVGHTPHPPVRCNIQTCKQCLTIIGMEGKKLGGLSSPYSIESASLCFSHPMVSCHNLGGKGGETWFDIL